MTPKSRLFPASFSAVLAIALLMSASLARAEVVTLVCENDPPAGGSFTLRVDYDQKTATFLASDGTTAYRSAPATITEGSVTWWGPVRGYMGEVVLGYPSNPWFSGSLNRLSGRGNAMFEDGSPQLRHFGGPCRRATKKF